MRVFEARTGSPLSAVNIRNRVLHPLLARLGILKGGLQAFRQFPGNLAAQARDAGRSPAAID
jgi:hypothetical protein